MHTSNYIYIYILHIYIYIYILHTVKTDSGDAAFGANALEGENQFVLNSYYYE